MTEDMIQYIFGNTNAKVSHNRIKWNIKASTEVPTSETEGHLGDVIVVTSANIKKLKFVATNNGNEELQDNSINVYEDFSVDKILVNKSNGFDMYIFGTSQNIMLNGETIIANVFFYDALTENWVQLQSAYRDAINLNSFTGQNINVDELWNISFTDSIEVELPTIIRQQYNDAFNIETFSGCQLDVDDYLSQVMPIIGENVNVNNLTII